MGRGAGRGGGARAIGQSELRHVALHALRPLFPYDHPDTLAGMQQEAADAQHRREMHGRRPPARRANHRALRIAHPFAPDWRGLLRQHGATAGATEVAGAVEAAGAAEASGAAGASGAAEASSPICVLRGERVRAALAASTAAHAAAQPEGRGGGRSRAGVSGRVHGARGALPLPLPPPPPGAWPQELLPRCLLRVSLEFATKGVCTPPAAIHAATAEHLAAWRADARWGGVALPAARGAADPSGALLGFVSSGGYDALAGRGVAVGFVAASLVVPLLSSDWNVGGSAAGAVLVLIRNSSSRQFRPALITVCA